VSIIGLIVLPAEYIVERFLFIIGIAAMWILQSVVTRFINELELLNIKHKNQLEEYDRKKKIDEHTIHELKNEIEKTEQQLECLSKINKVAFSLTKTLNKDELIKLTESSVNEVIPDVETKVVFFEKINKPHPNDLIAHLLMFPNLKRNLFIPDVSNYPQLKSLNHIRSIMVQIIDKTEQEATLIYGYIASFSKKMLTDTDNRLFSIIATIAKTAIINSILYETTQELAITDSLTSLFTHKYLKEKLNEEFKRAKTFNQLLGFLIVDVDDFKKINDSFGHQKGDELLKIISQILRSSLRSTDTIARYGGDEFAIILPYVTKENLKTIAEKLKKTIDEALSTWISPVHVSIGGSVLDETISNPEAFIAKADSNLYQAKIVGKNTLIIK
jgi:diguanylate cyclase (GGDEF)-like protein